MQDINDKDYIEAERLIEDCLRTGETSLKIKDLAIEGLPDAIGKLTHLKSLTIEYSSFNSNKKLETITQLVNLKNLECLELDRCKNLRDFSVFSKLKGLKTLRITSSPHLKNLNGLQNMAALEQLYASFCENLSDLSALSGLTGIKDINLRHSPHLKNLNVLQNLAALEKLYASDCENLSDLSALSGLTGIKHIDISSSPHLKNLNCLQNLAALEKLDASGCKNLSDLSALSGLTGIKHINLSRSPHLKNLNCLQYLAALEKLYASDCENLSDLSALSGLTGIKHINLSRSPHLKNLNCLQYLAALEKLYASDCENLSDLSALSGLTGIKDIDISQNPHLKNLNDLQNLAALEKLDASHCENLTDLSALSELTGIKHIDISSSPHLKNLNGLQNMAALEKLDASHCENLSDLSALSGLTGIKHIDISSSPHLKNLDGLQNLAALEELDASYCENLSDLSALSGLTGIKSISVRRSPHLKNLNGLQNMAALEELDASYCENLSDLSALSGLTGIKHIDISSSPHLKNLNGLQYLAALEKLSAWDCENLSDLSALSGLTGIKHIDISSSPHLKNLDGLQNLAALEKLDASDCENLSDLSALSGLTGIKDIDISQNPHLKNLNGLQNLAALEELYASDCENLSDLSALSGLTGIKSISVRRSPHLKNLNGLQNMAALEQLDASDCENLSDLSALSGLRALSKAALSKCKIKEFPRFLLHLEELSLYDNPIEDFPVELLGDSHSGNCLPAAKDYFDELKRGKAENSIRKWLILGNGRTGKTTLLKVLDKKKPLKDEKSTHGINIFDIDIDNTRIRFWDFGGQDLYLATHQVFMKSVDGILLCYRREEPAVQEDGLGWEWENKSLSYWMDMIRTTSPHACILPIEIAPEECAGEDPWDKAKKLKGRLLDKITIPDVFDEGISLKPRLDKVRSSLQETLSLSKCPLPKSWLDSIDSLSKLRKREKTIDWDTFKKKTQCLAPKTLLQYLHGSGELFHQSSLFGDRIILDQQWMLDAVYTLFDREEPWIELIKKHSGKFDAMLTHKIWPQHTEDEIELFLSMMESCAVALELTEDDTPLDEKTYCLPELGQGLEESHQGEDAFNKYPGELNESVIDCPFLHRGVINAWLAHAGAVWRDDVSYFRDGLHLDFEGSRIQVHFITGLGEYRQSGKIMVRAKGSSGPALQQFLDPVFQSIQGILDKSGIKNYSITGRLWKKREETEEVRPLQAIPESNRKRKVFVGYKKEEKEILDEVTSSLEQLRYVPDALNFEYLTDEEIKNGEEWDPLIVNEIKQADAVIFLLSGLYLKNEYCVNEITIAKETYEKKKKKGEYYRIHPLVLKVCHWEKHLGSIQGSPGKFEGSLLLYEKEPQTRDERIKNFVESVIDQLQKGAG